ncbi:MAG TPA: hypothetical protein DCW90_05865 [Lachnospiraceae bacterium]|nr:hypothetical protein [Lachnospiraceae bacterium]
MFLPIKRDKTFDTDPLITVSSNPVYLRKEIAKGIEKILFVPTDDLIGKKVNLIGRDSSMYYRVLGKTTSGLFILEDSYENLIKAHEEDILGTITKSQSGDVFTWTRN